MKHDSVKAPLNNFMQIDQCQVHQSAVEPGLPINIQPRCNCCNQPSSKLNFHFCFNLIDTLYLGPAIALFFKFLYICLVVVLLPMLSFSIVNILNNVQVDNSTKNIQFSTNLLFLLSNINSVYAYNQIYSYILAGISAIVFLLVPLGIIRSLKILDKLFSKDNKYFYPQILALLFKLDKCTNYSQQHIIKTLNQWYQVQMKLLNKKNVPNDIDIVEKIYFHFNMEFYQVLYKEMEDLERNQKNRNNDNNQNNYPSYPFQVLNKDIKSHDSRRSYQSAKSIMTKINRLQTLKQQLKNRQLQKTNKFIVVFKKLQYLQLFKQYQQKLCGHRSNNLVFGGENNAEIYDAPFPQQINYKIQHLTYKQKRVKRIISWTITVIVIMLGSAAQYLSIFLYQKLAYTSLQNHLSLILALCIYIISEVCNKFVSLTIPMQQQPNKSQFNKSYNRHLLISNIFLKCIVFNFSYFIQKIPIYANNGLIQTISWLMIIWGIFTVVWRVLNYRIIYWCLSRINIYNRVKYLDIPQSQANKLFEKPENNQYQQYAQLISLILISFIHASLVPISLIVCSISLIFSLIIQRIAFFSIYKQPLPANQSLFLMMSTLLWISIIGLALGQYYFIYVCSSLDISLSNTLKIVLIGQLVAFILIILVVVVKYRYQLKYDLTYGMIKDKIINCYSDFNQVYYNKIIHEVPEVPKSVMALTKKSITLVQQLNTISKSLQVTLRQRLFQPKNPVISAFQNRQQDSIQFQFDQKVQMPQKKEIKKKVPPFGHSRTGLIFKRSDKQKQLQKQKKLVKLTNLVKQDQQIQVKNKIKQAIRISIDKIN